VPVLASVVVIGGYIQRRVLGLPPFEDDGTKQFAAPEEIQVSRRKWTRKERLERLGTMEESDSSEPAAVLMSESPSEEIPGQEKTEE
jgi:hypothetical protein